jgi:hypothetical protein
MPKQLRSQEATVSGAAISYFQFPLKIEGRTVHVHGTSAQVELEDSSNAVVAYRGWGLDVAAFRQRVWFHVSLPLNVDWTATVFDKESEVDHLTVLTEIGAEYAYKDVMRVVGVHLWDASTRFAHWDEGNTQPAALKIGGSGMSWSIVHHIKHSVGLSLCVLYPVPMDAPVGQAPPFTLSSAHATFS